MRKFLIILIVASAFGEIYPVRILDKACLSADKALNHANQKVEFTNGVNWEIEMVDSMVFTGNEFNFIYSSLALDNNGTPHIVYNKLDSIIYISKVDTSWQKESVESGLFYACFSLIFDAHNTAHLSYYRKDDAVNMTYLCYAQRDTTGWIIDVVDSIYGIINNYWFSWGYYQTSIDLDTFDLPGIAYTSWNLVDSLHYLKYAHFNGTAWDTSVVEYDSVWIPHTTPSDWSPVLKFTENNEPIIAFHQIYDNPSDTIKIGRYNDSLGIWLVEPAICSPYGGIAISLTLNNQGYPCIAHGWNSALVYSWQDSASWYTEFTGVDIGLLNIRISLDLDSSGNPHIFYHPNGPVYYCYKNNIWHLCGRVDSSLDNLGEISLVLDNVDYPHVCFRFVDWDSFGQINFCGIKYARGTFTGVEQTRNKMPEPRYELQVYPNPFSKLTNISFDRVHSNRRIYSSYGTSSTERIELKIYDSSGRLIRDFLLPTTYSIVPTVVSWDGRDYSGHRVPVGIYFIRLSYDSISITKKVIFLK